MHSSCHSREAASHGINGTLLAERAAATRARCAAVGGSCRGMLDIVRALLDWRAGACNVVFIGDSLTLRSYHAALCDLQLAGARHARQYTAPSLEWSFVSGLANQSQVDVRGNLTEKQKSDLQTTEEAVFTIGNRTVRLLFVWRAGGSRRGPGLCGDAATAPEALRHVCRDLLASLGPCTATLYNEGVHHNANTSSLAEYGSSLRHMLTMLHTVHRRTGALGFARETSAQHFVTPEAPPGHEGTYDFANLSAGCSDTAARTTNGLWYNAVLRTEATRSNVSVVPFHNATRSWGSLIFQKHRDALDCTHATCYTPHYWAPLWESWCQTMMAAL